MQMKDVAGSATPSSSLDHATDEEVIAVASERKQSYVSPQLERLGRWSAMTLVVSVPIGPGD
jgi:hypothetical protein